uniref:Uncharacterized protein n=1 Tax=Ananas comosus var. bracteatus TaxID=296719 RepID=A0A6V7QYN9_ANACO
MVFFGDHRLYHVAMPPLQSVFEASCREIGDKESLIGSDCFWYSSERIDSRNSVQVVLFNGKIMHAPTHNLFGECSSEADMGQYCGLSDGLANMKESSTISGLFAPLFSIDIKVLLGLG